MMRSLKRLLFKTDEGRGGKGQGTGAGGTGGYKIDMRGPGYHLGLGKEGGCLSDRAML